MLTLPPILWPSRCRIDIGATADGASARVRRRWHNPPLKGKDGSTGQAQMCGPLQRSRSREVGRQS
jgi:hypothetical protein